MKDSNVLKQVLINAQESTDSEAIKKEMSDEIAKVAKIVKDLETRHNGSFFLRKAGGSVCRDEIIEFVGKYFVVSYHVNLAHTNGGVTQWEDVFCHVHFSSFMYEVAEAICSVEDEFSNSSDKVKELISSEILDVREKLGGIIDKTYTEYDETCDVVVFTNTFEYVRESSKYYSEAFLYAGKRIVVTISQDFTNEPGSDTAYVNTYYRMYVRNCWY